MTNSQNLLQNDFPHITGLDVINVAIDKCPSAKAFRYSAMALLTSQDLYILIGSIEDEVIEHTTRQDIKNHLHLHFASGQLNHFAEHMLTKAKNAPTEYCTDYYYGLYQAASVLTKRLEYLEFTRCYRAFANDNSEQAAVIKKQIAGVEQQAQDITKNQRVGE